MRHFGITKNVVVAAAKVTTKSQPEFALTFFNVEHDDAGAKDMAGVNPRCGHAVDYRHRLVVGDGNKLVERRSRIGLRVQGHDRWLTFLGQLLIQKHGVLFLNMRAVHEHDSAQIGGRIGGEDFSFETVPA